MSQASKHVKWCIAKANKEVQEAKELGKSPKHRGLLEINPNIEEAGKHITKEAVPQFNNQSSPKEKNYFLAA